MEQMSTVVALDPLIVSDHCCLVLEGFLDIEI